jgi:hypothetical protein
MVYELQNNVWGLFVAFNGIFVDTNLANPFEVSSDVSMNTNPLRNIKKISCSKK